MELSEFQYAPLSFQELLQAGRDYRDSTREKLAYLGGRVTYQRKARRIVVGIADAAAMLGCSEQRIRALAGQRRIVGARKMGPRRWRIPAYLQPNGCYLPKLTAGARGSELKLAAQLGIARPAF